MWTPRAERLVQLEGKTALVEHGGIRERIPFDSLVLAVGFRTDTSWNRASREGRRDDHRDAASPAMCLTQSGAVWRGLHSLMKTPERNQTFLRAPVGSDKAVLTGARGLSH
jgi:hypothetical protein